MKFLHKHRNAFVSALSKKGHSIEEFELVKRRGRIHFLKDTRSFAYFRKKEVSLNSTTGQWMEHEHFLVSIDNKTEQKATDWSEVMGLFESWIDSLRV